MKVELTYRKPAEHYEDIPESNGFFKPLKCKKPR
jgi:hypothetical protein